MGTNLEIFSFFSSLLSFKGKMISALSLCLIVLIPAMQSDSAMGGFSGMLADEKPTANGGGQSDTVKDVSSEAEARRVSVLKELGLQHRNKAVAFHSFERQDSPAAAKNKGGKAILEKNKEATKEKRNMNGTIHPQRGKSRSSRAKRR